MIKSVTLHKIELSLHSYLDSSIMCKFILDLPMVSIFYSSTLMVFFSLLFFLLFFIRHSFTADFYKISQMYLLF